MRAVLEFTLAPIGKCRVIVESAGEITTSIQGPGDAWADAPDHWRETVKDEALRRAMWHSTMAHDFACAASQGVRSGRTPVADAFTRLASVCITGET